MGILRFRIPDHSQFDLRFWESAYVAGAIEGIPKPSRRSIAEGVLSFYFDENDTCKLSLPWPTKDYGPVVLTSTSLKSSDVPYSLRLELARGTIHRIRTRAFSWEHIRGLRIPSAYHALMDQALEHFVQAVVEENGRDAPGYQAQWSIDKAIEASRSLARAYTSQVLQARLLGGEKLQTLFGVQLPTIPNWKSIGQELLPACNAVSVDLGIHRIAPGANRLADNDPVFQQLDWAKEKELKVIGGPLVSLQEGRCPSFINPATSFDQVCDQVFTRVGNVVSQCLGRVRLWDASASINACEPYQLSDEQAFRLASGIIGTIRSTDPKSPIIFCINLPAAEYMTRNKQSIDPFRFARSLIQVHDKDIAGIGLDLNLNCWPNGTLPRDLIDLSDIIDHWQFLEKSLLVRLTAPLSLDKDPVALYQNSIVSSWVHPGNCSSAPVHDCMQDTDPDLFGAKIGDGLEPIVATRPIALPPNGLELLQMLLSKPSVHGIIWNQAIDSSDHLFPNAGLFAADSRRRPLVECMSRLREQYVV